MFSRSLLPLLMWQEFMRRYGLGWKDGKLVEISDNQEAAPIYKESNAPTAYIIRLSEGHIEILPRSR